MLDTRAERRSKHTQCGELRAKWQLSQSCFAQHHRGSWINRPMPKQARRRPEMEGGRGKAFFVAVFYFSCSISMNFLNKAVVSSYDFNYPFFIMSCQMLATVIFLDISRLLKISKLNTYSLKDGVDFLPASLSFALHSTLSLMALHGMNIPMVMIN